LTIRKVTGGAVFDDEVIGKAIRWYYAKGRHGSIHYKKNGNRVPSSEGAVPMMALGDLPADIDYDWYITRANEMLVEIAAV
jgi:hypothetical protein